MVPLIRLFNPMAAAAARVVNEPGPKALKRVKNAPAWKRGTRARENCALNHGIDDRA